jgi:hypothetical protein
MLTAKVKKVAEGAFPNSWVVLLEIEGESIIVLRGIEPKKGAILQMEFLDRPGGVAAEIVDVMEQIDSETWKVKVRGVEFRVIELNSPKMPKEGDLILIEEEPLNPLLRN